LDDFRITSDRIVIYRKRLRRKAGRPKWKWTDDRLCNLWVRVQLAMIKHNTTKPRTAIRLELRAGRGKWHVDTFQYFGMDEPVELYLPNPTGQKVPTEKSRISSVSSVYDRAVAKMKRDPQFKQRCLRELEEAKRWIGIRVEADVDAKGQIQRFKLIDAATGRVRAEVDPRGRKVIATLDADGRIINLSPFHD
jgi:hypothetical protein